MPALVLSPFGLDRRLSAPSWPSLFASELPFRSMQRDMVPIFSSPFDDLEESVFGYRSAFDVLEAPFSRRRQQVRQSIKRRSPHSMEDVLLRISDAPLRTVTKRVCYQRGPDGKVVSETTTSVKNGNEPARRTVKRRIGNKVDVKTFIEAPKQKLASGREQEEDFETEWKRVTNGRLMLRERDDQLPTAKPSTSSPPASKDGMHNGDKADAPCDALPKAKHTYFDVEDWEEDAEEDVEAGGDPKEGEGAVEAKARGAEEKVDKVASPRGEGSLSMMERLQRRSRETSPILGDASDE